MAWWGESLSARCKHLSLRAPSESGGLAEGVVERGNAMRAKHTQRTTSMLAQFEHGLAGADEEIWFGFVFFQADGFAEGDAA